MKLLAGSITQSVCVALQSAPDYLAENCLEDLRLSTMDLKLMSENDSFLFEESSAQISKSLKLVVCCFQGDQIGLFFAIWANVSLGKFTENYISR
jgi:hypothetical protein